jgi:hypothetical protein
LPDAKIEHPHFGHLNSQRERAPCESQNAIAISIPGVPHRSAAPKNQTGAMMNKNITHAMKSQPFW